MELSWHITVSSYLPTVLSLWERKKEGGGGKVRKNQEDCGKNIPPKEH